MSIRVNHTKFCIFVFVFFFFLFFLLSMDKCITGERFGKFDGTLFDFELDVAPPRGSRSNARIAYLSQQTDDVRQYQQQQFAVRRRCCICIQGYDDIRQW